MPRPIDNVSKTIWLFLSKKARQLLSPDQCMALRDHMRVSTNALVCIKQVIKTFLSNCGILSAYIKQLIGEVEQRGVIPYWLVAMVDCIVTRKGNKQLLRNFYYSKEPTALLSLMI